MAGLNDRSARVDALSPTRLVDLRACPRRVALWSQQPRGHLTSSPSATLGLVAHRALELLLSPPPAGNEDWQSALRRAWAAAWREALEQSRLVPATSPARRALARIERVVLPALRSLLVAGGPDARVRCEVDLSARAGRIVGRADAIITSEPTRLLVDWKTGLVREDGETRVSYVDQMRLYAVMLRETEGLWPTGATLISLREGSVEVDIEPEACEAVADQALALLDAYHRLVPGAQPAKPGPSVCARCPFAVWCDAFWSAVTPGWLADPAWSGHALRGRLSFPPEHSAVGVSAVRVSVDEGTVITDEALVAGVPTAVAEHLKVGARVAAVGLSADPRTAQLTVGEWGRVLSTEDADSGGAR